MVTQVKLFIEKYIKLIKVNNFKELYRRARNEIPFQVGNLTYNLLEAGINPLQHLNVVVEKMFCDSIVNKITIPNEIKIIQKDAFRDCFELKEITLPATLEKIHERAFTGCYELSSIKFNGTKDQWYSIDMSPATFFDVATGFVDCIDGEVLLYHVDLNEKVDNTDVSMEDLIKQCRKIRIQPSDIFKTYKTLVDPEEFLDELTAGMQKSYKDNAYKRILLNKHYDPFYVALKACVDGKRVPKIDPAKINKNTRKPEDGRHRAALCDLLNMPLPVTY